MRHAIEVSVSKPGDSGVVRCRRIGMRERLMKLLFGETRRMWVIIPDTTVDTLRISEVPEGGEGDEPD